MFVVIELGTGKVFTTNAEGAKSLAADEYYVVLASGEAEVRQLDTKGVWQPIPSLQNQMEAGLQGEQEGDDE